MRFGVGSDRGKVRQINEDSYNIISGYPGIPVTFVIADGMGGHNSGEIASNLAVEFISNYILQFPEELQKHDTQGTIHEIIRLANMEIYQKSVEEPTFQGMGTTLILAMVTGRTLHIGHVGDSRAYLLREGEMTRITTDHSYIEELIKSGSISREEAERHPKKNIITRALGCFNEVEADIHTVELQEKDVILICTDGLTNMLNEDEIMNILTETKEPEQTCTKLIEIANEKGGEDNITVLVFKDF